MKIKNQFQISIVIFLVVLVVIVGSVATTFQQVAQLNSRQTIVRDIETGANDLSYLSNSYFLYQDNSSVSLWHTRFNALSVDLSQLNSSDPEQQALVTNINEDLQHLNTVFDSVVSFLQSAPRNVSVRVLPQFQTEWNRMAVQTQALAFDAQQLSLSQSNQIDQLNLTNILLINAFLGLFGAYFLTNYLITYRNTLKSIDQLQQGMTIIGAGDLDYALKADKQDEIGDLSRSVNQMASNLKRVTATKTELEEKKEQLENTQKRLEENACLLEEYSTQMEELANQRLEQLKNSERLAAIGATAGMVAHDIRNPLQAIVGDLYFARKDLAKIPPNPMSKNIEENLAAIESSVNYINKIVQDLQDFARPLRIETQEVNLDQLWSEIATAVKPPNSITIAVKINKDANILRSDPLILKRILTNLATNAVQALPNGGEIEIAAYRKAKDIVIIVADNGVGIPEEVKPRLFTPLVTTKSKGQGFGLAVVKRMTEALGGSVTFESEIGKGTRFILNLSQPNSID